MDAGLKLELAKADPWEGKVLVSEDGLMVLKLWGVRAEEGGP